MSTGRVALRFAIKFVAAFALLVTAFEATRGTAFERWVIEGLILEPTAWLLKMLAPGDGIELVGRTLTSGPVHLHVIRGCEGVEMFLLLGAGIAAFPATVQRKARGLLIGLALAYALSVGRLVVLMLTLQHAPAEWELLHGLVLPLAPILLLALFFLGWTSSSAETPMGAR
jgi:exosortase/archaeosortase family protein